MEEDDTFMSSWLSSDGQLLNLTWDDISPDVKSGPIMEWDDAAWVLSATFIIFSMQTGTKYFKTKAKRKSKNLKLPLNCKICYMILLYSRIWYVGIWNRVAKE